MLVEALVGFAAGIVSRYVVPDSSGIAADTLMGIVGGMLGGFTYKLFGHKPQFSLFDGWSVVCAAAGALILILVTRATTGRRTVV